MLGACGDGDGGMETPVAPSETPAPPAPAPTPSRVPANLRISASGEDFIEWSWDVVEGVSGYRVQFSLDEDFTEDDEIIAGAAAQNAYRRLVASDTEPHLRVQSAFGAGDATEYSEWSAPVPGRASAAPVVPSVDRAALVALFEATNGPMWNSAENWLTDAPLREWYGVWTDDHRRVTRLALSQNDVTGSLPPEIGQLTHLRYLNFHHNELTGSIPPEIAQLTRLETLDLADNEFSGPIPLAITQLRDLTVLWLHENNWTGSIPPEIGQLARLEDLALQGNDLTGAIPAEIGRLTRLRELTVRNNRLTGSVPPEIGQLARLEALRLLNNELTGSIPAEVGQLGALSEGP